MSGLFQRFLLMFIHTIWGTWIYLWLPIFLPLGLLQPTRINKNSRDKSGTLSHSYYSHTVDGSEIPNNHLTCMKPVHNGIFPISTGCRICSINSTIPHKNPLKYGNGKGGLWEASLEKSLIENHLLIFLCKTSHRTPRTQMTIVLNGKGLVLEGWPSKIEVIGVLGTHTYRGFLLEIVVIYGYRKGMFLSGACWNFLRI